MYEERKYSSNAIDLSGSAYTATATGVGTQTDVPRVSRETGTIQKLIAEHTEMANTLEQRLHAVLRPTEPSPTQGEAKEPRSPTSPLTSDLETFRVQLGRVLDHYRDILNRLEV